ncbi:class I adenylate-forming enzyme family protein [Bradyrhizobium sp. 21]|uniref:class I adenylate-forming enzyme family protein n=1 Tax=Bradyrhizobium sp. 21 TaxID=2782666 RepID=UPI001FFBAED2|nr:class I adenylate-forming enzyme family protein [Bradyrhizobium sp. 21]MCK1387646.1 acyl--CoA ligase [Bradyrhizobium sp. 21]
MSKPNQQNTGHALFQRGFAVNVDGSLHSRLELIERSDVLAARLIEAGIGRIALDGRNLSAVTTSLGAALSAGCEVVLLRNERASDLTLRELAVEAFVAPDGSIMQTDRATGSREPSMLIPTSGTTGPPKWARHALSSMIESTAVRTASLVGQRFLLTFHGASFAGLQVLLSAASAGGEICGLASPGMERLAKLALEYPPTVVSGTPSFWRNFLLTMGNRASSLPIRYITLGGEIVDQAILDLLRKKFPHAKMKHVYASTETGPLAHVEDGLAGLPAEWLHRDDLGFQLAIRQGCLCVRSKHLMTGYANGRGDRDRFDQDGYFSTGDKVKVNGDRIVFEGRADAIINVGGAKVSPEELEHSLVAMPGVVDVIVYGLPNPVTGFVVAADVVLDGNTDPTSFKTNALSALGARFDRYKIPRRFRIVESLHRTEAGKLERR